MAKRRDITRDASQAPSYAHWHASVSYPSGKRDIGRFWNRKDALALVKADRESSRDGFGRSVHWCTAPTEFGNSYGCWPIEGEREQVM